MDQTESYLTQSIVGKPQRLFLGVKIRLEGEATDLVDVQESWLSPSRWVSSSLQWVSRVASKGEHEDRQRSTGNPEARPFQRGLLLYAAVSSLAAGGFFIWWMTLPTENASLAVAMPASAPITSPQTPQNINLETAPFPIAPPDTEGNSEATDPVVLPIARPPQREGPSTQVEDRGPLPAAILPSSLVDTQARPSSQATSGPDRKTSIKPSAAGDVDSDEKKKPSGLVLDMESGVPTQQKSAASGQPSTPVPRSQPTTAVKLVEPVVEVGGSSAQGAARPSTPRPTIVDIAEDNSYVLITNPGTRLPQKFQVGQTVLGVGTLQRIDHAKGTVQIDGRSYGLQ